MPVATRCFITRATDLSSNCENDGWKEVSVICNQLLQSIMKSYDSWSTSPIIFVGDNKKYVYKIITIKETNAYAYLYQVCFRFDTRYKTYEFLNKRKVIIWFV